MLFAKTCVTLCMHLNQCFLIVVRHVTHQTLLQKFRGRHASSGYEVLEPLADAGAARLRWRLRAGRQHASKALDPVINSEAHASRCH